MSTRAWLAVMTAFAVGFSLGSLMDLIRQAIVVQTLGVPY